MRRLTARGLLLGAAVLAAAGTAGFTYVTASGGSEQSNEAAYTAAHRAEASVPEEAAVRSALDRHAGTATDVHLENEGHGLRWEVKPRSGTQVWEVQVDARSGQVVSDHPDE
jgi:uncharacterized membrane protein YkoI